MSAPDPAPGDRPAPASVSVRLRAALAATTERLGRAEVPSPSADARLLLAAAARTTGHLLLLEELPGDFAERLEELTRRRERREPLQLILGTAPFRGLELRVRPGVFVPRPETELALDLALAALREPATGGSARPPRTLVDLCTGSGALAAAALAEVPAAHVLAVDVDPAAVDLARENLAAVDPERGTVLRADLGDPVPGTARRDLDLSRAADRAALSAGPGAAGLSRIAPVDLVLSNPPYVPPDAVPRDPEVARHDPPRALYGGGADGLDLPRRVLDWSRHLLRPGGVLVMEHADVQGAAARALAAEAGGFEDVRTAADLTGRDRFLVARRAARDDGPGHGRLSR